jgi:hypothetical protein
MLTLVGVGLDTPVWPAKLKLVGFTASTAVAGFTVKVAETFLLVSAWLVAVTTTVVDEDTVGAVNKPAAVIAPAVADQVTPGFEVLLTVALNCCAAPEAMVTLIGEAEMLTGRAAAPVESVWSRLMADTESESRDRTRK